MKRFEIATTVGTYAFFGREILKSDMDGFIQIECLDENSDTTYPALFNTRYIVSITISNH